MVTVQYNINLHGQSRKHLSTLHCYVYYAGSIINYYESCDVSFTDLRHLCDMRREGLTVYENGRATIIRFGVVGQSLYLHNLVLYLNLLSFDVCT